MIYFLGGPPKVGKSIISKTITKKYGISVVSTDSLGAVLENILDPEIAPGLFIINRFNTMSEAERIHVLLENTMERIHLQIQESRAVWKAVKPFIQREEDKGRDVMVEGVAVLPEFVHQLENIDYRTVFIGNQGKEHKENIRKGADEHEHDWMRHTSDEYIDAFAAFVVKMSDYIENEARKYGFKYVEINKIPFHNAANVILNSLLITSER